MKLIAIFWLGNVVLETKSKYAVRVMQDATDLKVIVPMTTEGGQDVEQTRTFAGTDGETVAHATEAARIASMTNSFRPWQPFCPTCGGMQSEPYRVRDKGAIVQGCIDSHHSGFLSDASDLAWHNREQAVLHRAKVAQHLRDLIKQA